MGYISIKQILDDLLADDMMKGLSLERAVNYAVEFMRIVGSPTLFETKVDNVVIENYKGLLPCDLYDIIQVRDAKNPAYVYSSSTFINDKVGLTYKIQGKVIITALKDGCLQVSYRAIKVDNEGYPTIEDNASYIRALELYIQKRYFTILFNSSKIPQAVLQNVQQEYAWAVGQAQSNLIKPTLDQMQSFTNMYNTLIPKIREHSKCFNPTSQPEILKI